jgi:alcohol dehydrogenase
MSQIFAREAFFMVFNNLMLVKDKPSDIEVRSKILYGAYLAGISLINSGSGVAGALSYPLGVHYKVPHGIAGAVFIPHIIRYNQKAGYDFCDLYDLIDGADRTLPKDVKNERFSDKIFALCKKLEVPENLGGFGVNASTVHHFLNDIDSLERAFAQNPVPFTIEDGKKLVRSMTPKN